jgi:putative phosphoribosyl transferase
MLFQDRTDAGGRLAERLAPYRNQYPVVLALVRGGVPVAFEVARILGAPLDIVLVRKIGAPGAPELAAGAVVDGPTQEIVLNPDVVSAWNITDAYIEAAARSARSEIERRRKLYLADRKRPPVTGQTAIVVDDGIATGATMRAALRAVRRQGPTRLLAATPIAAEGTVAALRSEADEIVSVSTPPRLGAIGMYYLDFSQVSDDEVIDLLNRAQAWLARPGSNPPPHVERRATDATRSR